MSDGEMRLARFLAKAGIASRRKSEALITAGQVTVNGETITTPACNVDPARDTIAYKGERLSLERHVYYLLNKPPGYTCTARDPHAGALALELLNVPQGIRVFSVGRLDRESEGLLLFTNDGKLAHELLHPRFEVPKTYRVWVTGQLRPPDLDLLTLGFEDAGDHLVAQAVRIVSQTGDQAILSIVVNEGKKHEVRRMCARLGCQVQRLLRTQFGPLTLGELEPGASRALTGAELSQLRQAAG